jgi:hypothetical protein
VSTPRHRVTGHRVVPGGLSAGSFRATHSSTEKRPEFFGVLLKLLTKYLTVEVQARVETRIRQGLWNKGGARHKRYNYYRTWLQYRYGSDRARKKLRGSLRERKDWVKRTYRGPRGGETTNWVKRSQIGEGFKNMPNIMRDPVLFSQFEFISRRILRNTRYRDGYSMSGSLTRRRVLGGYAMRAGNKHANVDEAIKSIKTITDTYHQMLEEKGTREAVSYMRAAGARLAADGFALDAFLRESKAGQRLLRQAREYSLRIHRNRYTLGASDVVNKAMAKRSGAPEDAAMRFARDSKELRDQNRTMGPPGRAQLGNSSAQGFTLKELKKVWDADELGGKRRAPAVVTATGFPYGYQTGTLASAWGKASAVTRRVNDSLTRITFVPNANDKVGRHSLTDILKRRIQKKGGNPALLPQKEGRDAIREAMTEVISEFQAYYGGRVRFRKRR